MLKKLKNRFLLLIVLSISMGLLIPSAAGFSQNHLSINNDIGAGGGNNSSESSGDNTTLYIVGGAVIAGILLYALVFKKDKVKKEEESDSTSAAAIISEYNYTNSIIKAQNELDEFQEKVPIDIYLGVRDNYALNGDRTYLMGVSVKF